MTGLLDAAPLAWAVIALALAATLVRLLLAEPFKSLVVDRPNERSLHVEPVPRIGGAGLLAAALALWAIAATDDTLPILLLALFLAGTSLRDDFVPLSPRMRLAAQFVVAVAVAYLYPVTPLLLPILVLTLVWMANLYNFMDGSDGLAGGMAMFGFGAYAIAAHAAGARELALASAVLSGAAAGFLIWNFPRARIFMGDVGAVPLGFLAGALGYLGWSEGVWPFYFPALAFLPFIADATVTLAQRALRRERLSAAHRSHYYQRLNRMGLGHRGTALVAYALMAAAALSALLVLSLAPWQAAFVIALWIAALAALMARVDRAWRLFEAKDEAGVSRS